MFRVLRQIASAVLFGGIFAGTLFFSVCHDVKIVSAAQVLMKDGRVIKGRTRFLARVHETPANAEDFADAARSILAIDDGLRKIFVPRYSVADLVAGDVEESLERFRIPRAQSEVTTDGKQLGTFASFRVYEPFDEFGRRIVILNNQIPVEQSIVEINPRYIVVKSRNIVWDMREATSNYPRELISKILLKQIDPKNPEERKRIVRFYIQAERYSEARAEIASILEEFGSDENVVQELQPIQKNLAQLEIEKIRRELELRRNAGQFAYVKSLLPEFPVENASVENLQSVRNMIEADAEYETHREKIVSALENLASSARDETLRKTIQPVVAEIASGLNQNTVDRFLPLQLLLDDPGTPDEQKLALGLSGWLVGADAAVTELPLVVSMLKTKELLKQYLTSYSEIQRNSLLQSIQAEQAGKIEIVAKILPLMKPLFPLSKEENPEKPGYFTLTTPAFADLPPYTYHVQLPPEYDPNRRYPLIITLHGSTTPDQQLDWWCGTWRDGKRYGQAGRHGYIVIAPYWNVSGSTEYDYSAYEHGAVLYSLYDAMRHFSIDSDRVFLTGHSTGGDAAWDVGLSHPDLWAGVIPITASGRKYVRYYLPNAKYVPLYFVSGELDGVVAKEDNNYNFNNYMATRCPCTIVNFLGRGHENFSDERLNLFEWMQPLKRQYPNKDFSVRSLRPWDNNFWWVEASDFFARNMIDPFDWPKPPGPNLQPAKIEGRVNAANGVRISSNSDRITIWLSPDLIDFNQKTELLVNGRRAPMSGRTVEGKLEDMLEDVRTRFDRQHPFWLKYEYQR
ncbi:MAG: alpha/beta hydrolase-fold protein [Planctomycetaceae bacterium]|nr:alpha/beta hydrolase-fold protein [Planctomycetaceae bacterium]